MSGIMRTTAATPLKPAAPQPKPQAPKEKQVSAKRSEDVYYKAWMALANQPAQPVQQKPRLGMGDNAFWANPNSYRQMSSQAFWANPDSYRGHGR